jgi:hypothetical protein
LCAACNEIGSQQKRENSSQQQLLRAFLYFFGAKMSGQQIHTAASFLSLLSLSHTHASTAQRNALSSTYAQIMAILVKSAINFAQADDKKTRFTRCLWFSFRPQRIRRLSIDFIIKLMYRWIGIFHHKQTPRMYARLQKVSAAADPELASCSAQKPVACVLCVLSGNFHGLYT